VVARLFFLLKNLSFNCVFIPEEEVAKLGPGENFPIRKFNETQYIAQLGLAKLSDVSSKL
jgi:hypothetical protein